MRTVVAFILVTHGQARGQCPLAVGVAVGALTGAGPVQGTPDTHNDSPEYPPCSPGVKTRPRHRFNASPRNVTRAAVVEHRTVSKQQLLELAFQG